MAETPKPKGFNWGAFGTLLAAVSMAFAVGVYVQTRTSSTSRIAERIGDLEQLVAKLPVGTIIAWDPVVRGSDGTPTGDVRALPEGWAICNGLNGTPNLVDRFLVGTADHRNIGITGGRATIDQDGEHNHSGQTGVVGDSGEPKENGNDGRHVHGHSHTITQEQSHDHGGENRPPFYTVIYIVKIVP